MASPHPSNTPDTPTRQNSTSSQTPPPTTRQAKTWHSVALPPTHTPSEPEPDRNPGLLGYARSLRQSWGADRESADLERRELEKLYKSSVGDEQLGYFKNGTEIEARKAAQRGEKGEGEVAWEMRVGEVGGTKKA